MLDVYENCPIFENEKYILRFSNIEDAKDLVSVYGDKNALPFFNSDNCHGENFYYPDEQSMTTAIEFWLKSYKDRWFVRWTILDKASETAIGSIELFHRVADDDLNHVGVLRLDLGSQYEQEEIIYDILNLIITPAYEMFDCEEIITKVPLYAIERIEALSKLGFEKNDRFLVGTMDGYAYKDYWTIKKDNR